MTVWLVYYADWSAFGIFENEIDALRYAVDHVMKVKSLTLPVQNIRDEE